MLKYFALPVIAFMFVFGICSCGNELDLGQEDNVTDKNDSSDSSKNQNNSDDNSYKAPEDNILDDPKDDNNNEWKDDEGTDGQKDNEGEEYVPTGEIIYNGSTTPNIIKGYPYMIIYGGDNCYWCTYLEVKKVTPRLSWFKGRVHVYVVNNASSTPNNTIVGYPLTEFYDKEGNYYTSEVGGSDAVWEKMTGILEELTETSLD